MRATAGQSPSHDGATRLCCELVIVNCGSEKQLTKEIITGERSENSDSGDWFKIAPFSAATKWKWPGCGERGGKRDPRKIRWIGGSMPNSNTEWIT